MLQVIKLSLLNKWIIFLPVLTEWPQTGEIADLPDMQQSKQMKFLKES